MNILKITTIVTTSTIILTGCQSLKVVSRAGKLEDNSTSRVQFLISGDGKFTVYPGSEQLDEKNDKAGIVAARLRTASKLVFSNSEFDYISKHDLGMPKYDSSQSKYYVGISKHAKPFTNEHYVKSNEPLTFNYSFVSQVKSCGVSGSFVPMAHTDYRLSGIEYNGECMIVLHKMVKGADGRIKLKTLPIKEVKF